MLQVVLIQNRQNGVKCGLNHNKRQDILKLNKRHCHLQKTYHVQYMNIKKKAVGIKKNIDKHGLLFHYNIREDPLLGIGYVSIRWITCSC